MQYSTTFAQWLTTYAITPQGIAVAILLAHGLDAADTATAIFGTKAGNTRAAAARYLSAFLRSNGGVTALRDAFTLANCRAEMPNGNGNGNGNENGRKHYRTKEDVLTALENVLPELKGTERAKVLCQIADLQRLKQDENTDKQRFTHFYLPQIGG
jgi:hypothetical protein